MELRQLECFLAVAEELHFGRASERLHLAQPSVSEAIRRLEAELGGPLLERTTRKVRLTALGESFRAQVQPAYETIISAGDQAKLQARGISGSLKIGFTGVALGDLTVKILRLFAQRYPHVEVSMVELDFAAYMAPVRDGRLDLGIARLPIEDSELELGPVIHRQGRVLASRPITASPPASAWSPRS